MNPRELDSDDLNQQLDAMLGGISDADMEAAASRPRKAARPDERGRIRGTILEVRGPEVLVDIGGKSEAWVALDQFEADDPPAAGQVRFFMMHGLDRETGVVRLSLREVRADGDLDSLQAGDLVEARVTGMNTGGLELTVKGLRGFMPRSQVDLNRIEDFAPFIGRKIECEVAEVDRRGRTVVLSRRRLLERQREAARQELKYSLAEGQTRKGTVKRLADFGAFVDIGGIDGLLHVSDMSWGRVKHPSEVLQVGQEVEVQILKIDPARDRVSLGMKQLAADPWNVVEANYRIGATTDGRVVRLLDFGAFVELEPGVEGLLPVSEISWTQRVRHPKDVLKEGDPVRVSVLAVDAENRKLTLSLKALSGNPWTDAAERYTPDSVVSGRVTRTTEFGAFVQLEEGLEGLVHISEMSDKHVRSVSDVMKPDQVVQVRVKAVDGENRRISLSLRGIGPDGRAVPASAAAAGAGPDGAAAHAEPAAPPAPPKRRKALKGGLE